MIGFVATNPSTFTTTTTTTITTTTLPPILTTDAFSTVISSPRPYSSPLHTPTTRHSYTTSSLFLGGSVPMVPLDPSIKAAAVSYFTGIRIPTILVSGSSVAALFALSGRVKNTTGMTRTEIFLYRIHHILALFALCLSLSSVVTSTTATTLLLLSKQALVPKSIIQNMDAYHFLKTNMPFEFLYTRWSFINSVLLFLGSTMTRLLLEFDLFKPRRRIAGWGVFCAMVGVQSFLISYVNTTQNCWRSMWGLTRDVFWIVWNRAVSKHQPMMMVSLSCFVMAILLCVAFLLPSSIDYDQMADNERYT